MESLATPGEGSSERRPLLSPTLTPRAGEAGPRPATSPSRSPAGYSVRVNGRTIGYDGVTQLHLCVTDLRGRSWTVRRRSTDLEALCSRLVVEVPGMFALNKRPLSRREMSSGRMARAGVGVTARGDHHQEDLERALRSALAFDPWLERLAGLRDVLGVEEADVSWQCDVCPAVNEGTSPVCDACGQLRLPCVPLSKGKKRGKHKSFPKTNTAHCPTLTTDLIAGPATMQDMHFGFNVMDNLFGAPDAFCNKVSDDRPDLRMGEVLDVTEEPSALLRVDGGPDAEKPFYAWLLGMGCGGCAGTPCRPAQLQQPPCVP